MPKRPPLHRPLGARSERERQRDVNRRRKKGSTSPYKTAEWQAFRRWYLRRHPICEESGCYAPSKHVDHIVPLSKGGAHCDEANS